MRQPGQRGKNAAAANCAPLSNTTAPPLCRASACHSGSTPAGAPPRRQSSTARERGFTSSTACPPQAKTGRKASRTAACTSAGRAGTGQVIPDGNMTYSQPGRRRTHWVSAPVSVCSVPHNSHPAPPGWPAAPALSAPAAAAEPAPGPNPASARAGRLLPPGRRAGWGNVQKVEPWQQPPCGDKWGKTCGVYPGAVPGQG